MICLKMKILMFFVLLLKTSSTSISVTGSNGKLILQPMSSPGLVLRKVPRTLSPIIRTPARQTWPNIIFLKHLFELECLKEIYGQGRRKNRPGSTRPESFVPGQEGPAYKTVNKNQGNNYDKIPDPYRPSTTFENGERYFGGNVRVIPMPVPYRNNMNGYQRYKADLSKEGSKFIKGSSPHSNREHNVTEIEKVNQDSKELPKKTPPHYTTTSRSTTTTTTRSSIEGSVNKPIKFYRPEITDEHVIPFKELITGSSGIPKQDSLPMMVSYGDAKTFSKFSRQSNRRKPTTASYPENTSSNNLWYGSKPRPNHSYEVEEIIEENIRFDLEGKKEENHVTRKPLGGRQFKFDENAYEGFEIVVPNMMKPAKNKVIDSSINTVLNSLISPVERITETKTPDKSNSAIITPSSPALRNSASLPKNENFPEARETLVNLPPLLPHASVDSLLSQEDKTGYMTSKTDLHILPHRPNNYFNSFRASTTEKAQPAKKDEFLSRQSVSFQDWKPHSTRKYDTLPLQPFSPGEFQRNINYRNIAETRQKTDDDFTTAKPNDLHLPEVFRDLANGFSKVDRISLTPKVAFSEENKMSSTFSPIPYDEPSNLIPSSRNRSNQSTTPPKTTQQVLFAPNYSPETYNNSDSQIFEQKTVQQLFTSVPLSESTIEDQNTETEQPEKDERTSTQSEFFDIQTKFDLLDADKSKSKPETENDQSLLMPVKSADDQHSISKSVAMENLFTTEFYTENTITDVLHPGNGESSSSSSPLSFTTMAVSKNDVKFTTERNYFEEDEDVKTTSFEELVNVSMTVDLLNTSKKDSAQESNWKNSRKMHFNQEPTHVIVDNRITDDTEIGQRRSDILINDTLEDYGENQNQIHSLSYLDNLEGNSSHLNPGSLIEIAPESIIPVVPSVINDLRDGRLSEENLKVLSHAFGKYWPYIQALSKNTNLDVLPLIKMKDKKDLERILTSFVLDEPNTTTTVKQQDYDYAHAYDYLGDYKELYQDLILSQELGKENQEKIRIKRDEEDDLKTSEATREYFESIAEEEQNEEGSDYIYEDIMYDDIPDEESDSSIFELMEIADLQVYVRNVTS